MGVILLLLLLVGAAAGAALFSFSRSDTVQLDQDKATTQVLMSAKAALLGYAVSRGVVRCSNPGNATACAQEEEARPGELPCPDTNNDGYEDSPCRAGPLVGRLPWRTLGMPEPRDATGEILWYAVAGPFRNWDSNANSASALKRINSDTRGNITVLNANGTALTNNAVAVVFAPGAPFGSQARSGTVSAACSLTNAQLLQWLCSSNYLESITTITPPSATDGPYIRVTSGVRSAAYNDRVMFITTSELIPPVEMRVGGELKRLLQDYRDNSLCQCYPWADTWPYSGGIADIGQNRGRFPTEPFPEDWGSGSIPRLPTWLGANDWHNLFWYSVAKQNSDDQNYDPLNPAGHWPCRTCAADLLTVDGTPVSALFFTPGTPQDGVARLNPPSGQSSRIDNLALYLEDAANNDAGNASNCPDVGEIGGDSPSRTILSGTRALCDQYTRPTSRSFDRDRLYTVGEFNAAVCSTQAQAVLNVAPCGVGYSGSSVNPVCTSAISKLDGCPCKSAARVMVNPPCRNESNSPQCQAAIATLQSCGTP
jgi:hypothetical protein